LKLAKQHVDVGLFTNNAEAMLAFWQQEVGLAFEETLPLGGGVRQHRHAMNGSVLKLNDARDPMAATAPAGYRELVIAREGTQEPRVLMDPDGNRVMLVRPGHQGVTGIAVRMAVRDEAAQHAFLGSALQLERADERAYRCGDSLIAFEQDASLVAVGPMTGQGFRYLTVQVWDVDAEHAGIIERGGAEGRPPLTLGTTARISFVRDPDGNWIEVSQGASLTGALPAG
jgi:lactoylglutathione lyase